jgi:hypothetical protein
MGQQVSMALRFGLLGWRNKVPAGERGSHRNDEGENMIERENYAVSSYR